MAQFEPLFRNVPYASLLHLDHTKDSELVGTAGIYHRHVAVVEQGSICS